MEMSSFREFAGSSCTVCGRKVAIVRFLKGSKGFTGSRGSRGFKGWVVLV